MSGHPPIIIDGVFQPEEDGEYTPNATWGKKKVAPLSKLCLDNPVETSELIKGFQHLISMDYTINTNPLSIKNPAGETVFSSDEKTKTCSFTQPFDHNVVDAYVKSLPKTADAPLTILKITECDSFATLKAFIKESENRTDVKFYIPDTVKGQIKDFPAKGDFELAKIEKFLATQEEVSAQLNKRNAVAKP